MPQTVYTTDEVAEIREQYEARLQRLTAEKEKAEREKELLEQKISRLLQPLVAEFCPRSATPQSARIPPGVGRRELSDGGPSVPAGQEEVVVKEEDSARWRNGGNPADKTEARGRAGERGGRPGEKRRRSAEREGERGHRSYEAASGVKKMRKPQVGKFRCDVENCGFSSAYGANLDRHKKRSCIEVKGDGASKRRVGGEYRCSQCPKSYARKASLRRHGEDEHGPRQFCPHCGFGIKKSRLSRHVKVCSRRRLEKVSRNEPEAEERSEDDEETEQEPEDIASLEKLGQDLESLID